MGQAFLAGDTAQLERLTPADVTGLKEGMQRYGLLLTHQGTIKDDFMFSRLAGEAPLYLVVNAGTKEGDFAYIAESQLQGATLTPRFDRALLALQGPRLPSAWNAIAPALPNSLHASRDAPRWRARPLSSAALATPAKTDLRFHWKATDADRLPARSWPKAEVLPIGLGARDSLRLEAGLCLYGHDMDETKDPVEANLVWSIGKRRKTEGGFAGADIVLDKLFNGVARKRVGILPDGRAPAREGTEIVKDGVVIGVITSGGFGPSKNGPVAMGYVQSEFAENGTSLELRVRGQGMPARVAPMPFIPHRL
jgi:aminomethyltransferase